MNKLRNYTVLLLRPDYIASEFGHDTFCARIKAESPTDALLQAKVEACKTDDNDVQNHEDYYSLSCTIGWRKDFVDGNGGVI